MKTDNLPGLYIHIPFCEQKCAYCDFFSEPPAGRLESWKDALLREVRRHAGFAPLFGSLYIGGGTPSLLPPDMLAGITGRITDIYDFDDSAEVTVELNPEHVTPDFISFLQDTGFNRLSLGIQSFRDDELEFLGRRHRGADSERALEICMGSGIGNVSIDLIYALRGQSLRQWEYNLKRALTFRPDHLSCYQLTVKEGTVLGELAERGEVSLPPEEVQREMFIAASGTLRGAGYSHYEVSSFRLGASGSRHNRLYWRHLPYLGLGPSAHSFDGSCRWWNSRSLDEYIRDSEGGPAGVEKLSPAQLDLEKIFLGLRTSEGVDLELAAGYSSGEGVIEMLAENGLAEVRGGRLVPTLEGYLFSDSIPLYFTG
ncbi:MAG: radical SAM family heme chaperone HemW [Candidatus Krumholzibacteriales bacterium]